MITIARWFGGTKLGTGGLVHAYSDAAKAALANAEFTELVPMTECDLTLPYNLYNPLISKTSALGAEVTKEQFDSEISLTLSIKSAHIGELEKAVSETGNGKITFTIRK